MSASDSVDPVEFARLGRMLADERAIETLPRLAEQLARSQGVARYQIAGRVRPDGKPAMQLHVEARVLMTCHRCLGELEVPVESTRELVFVAPERMPAIEDEEADTDYLPMGDRVDPIAIVEEELMLALPMVPRHDRCAADEAADKPENTIV